VANTILTIPTTMAAIEAETSPPNEVFGVSGTAGVVLAYIG